MVQANVLAVQDLARLTTEVVRKNSKGTVVKMLHHDAFGARLLGMRVATPEYFKKGVTARIRTSQSIKCQPVVTLKKTCLDVSRDFQTSHPDTYQLLVHATTMPKSKWFMSSGVGGKAKAKHVTTVQVNQLADIHNLVMSFGPCIDRIRSTIGKFDKVSVSSKDPVLASASSRSPVLA